MILKFFIHGQRSGLIHEHSNMTSESNQTISRQNILKSIFVQSSEIL